MGNTSTKINPKEILYNLQKCENYKEFVEILTKNYDNIKKTRITFKNLEKSNISKNTEIIKYLFCFVTKKLYLKCQKVGNLSNETIIEIKTYLPLISKLSILLIKENPEKLYDLFWKTIDVNVSIKIKRVENKIKIIKIEEKDFIGNNDQLTIGLKLYSILLNLIFKENFTIVENIKKSDSSFFKSKNKEMTKNRIIILEFILIAYIIEERFKIIDKKEINPIILFFRCNYLNTILIKSLLNLSVHYSENGILPYSAYLYRNFLENDLYCSALSINLSLFLLKELNKNSIKEILEPKSGLRSFLCLIYLKNHNIYTSYDLGNLFNDEEFLVDILETVFDNILSIYKKDTTLLPNSFEASPFIEEMLYLFLTLLNNKEDCPEILSKFKKNFDLIIPLLILLDKSTKSFENGLYYIILSCLLKLMSCILKSKLFLYQFVGRKRV